MDDSPADQYGVPAEHVDYADLEAIARHPLSGERRPFVRWAGSKRALLSHLVPALPRSFRRYREPFVGSGALFFLLRPTIATLSDSCAELMDAYRAVRDQPDRILEWLRDKKPDHDFYYALRANRSPDPVTHAAEFLYLNRTCWNGLYRVNSRGVFNVPYGRPKTDTLIDPQNLLDCSRALQGSRLCTMDFEAAVEDCARGDLVFFDPPYVTGHNSNGFIDYNEQLFSWADQQRLATVANDLVARGVTVIVTNAAHEPLLRLYRNFSVSSFERFSTLASNPERRGRVCEVVLTSGTPN